MDQEKLNKIVEGATVKNKVKTPFIKATITKTTSSALCIETEFNVNHKKEAAALIACLASEFCENRADYNALITLIRKQINQDKRREMAERRK